MASATKSQLRLNCTLLMVSFVICYVIIQACYFMLVLISANNLPAGFPRIVKNPDMKVVETGRNAILFCEAAGDPPPSVYWVKDTLRLEPDPRFSILDQGALRGKIVIELFLI